MKKQVFRLLLFSAILFTVSLSASAQIYVKVRPPRPIIVRPPAPSPVHVWIGEEWNEDGGNYRYAGGRWDSPPHPGDRWYPGHWSHHRGQGHIWVRGYWRGKGERRR